MSKPVLIVNPKSGQGLSESAWARLAGPIGDGLGAFDVRFTERAGHARDIAAEEARAGRALVVAVGGDGTISEVAGGILAAGDTQAALGIIPRGTGGDLRRSLDLPQDAGKAAAHLAGASVRTIDAGRATLTGADGGAVIRHFVNVGSFGFSAAVADSANRASKRLGAKAAFLGATVRTLVAFDNVDVRVTFDDEEPVQRRLLLGAIGNARYFGGGMKICPEAELDDGLLDAVLVGDLSRTQIILKTNRLYDGTHLAMDEVSHRQVKRVHIEAASGDDIRVELDGETNHGGGLPATFEVLPGALRLRA